MKKKLLITGGTGLIGQALIDKIVVDFDITVLTRQRPQKVKNLPSDIEYIHSLDELEDLNTFIGVINLAGEPIVSKKWSAKQKSILETSRWDVTQKLVDLIQKSEDRPKVFISASAIGYYGRQNAQQIDESFSQITPEFSHHLCKKWEDIANQAHSESTRVCILRTGVVLSAKGGALSKMRLPFLMGLGGPIGRGKQYMSWIHIDDMVRGILHLLNKQACHGVYNFTAPHAQSNKQFSRKYAASLNRPAIMPMPPFVLKALMGEMSDLLIYGQNVCPQRLLQSGFTFRFQELSDAFENIKNPAQ